MRSYPNAALMVVLLLLSACSRGPIVGPAGGAAVPPTTGVELPPAWTPTPGQIASAVPQSLSSPPPAGTQETPAPESRALQRTDLPGGFSPVAIVTYHLTPAVLGGGSLTPLAFSAFGHNGDDTLAFSATFALTDPAAQQAFAGLLQSPETLLSGLASAMGTIERAPAGEQGMPKLGDRSAAARASALIGGAKRDLELAIFSAGPIGGYVLVVTRQGKVPAVNLQSAVASLLNAQTPTPTPQPASPTPGA